MPRASLVVVSVDRLEAMGGIARADAAIAPAHLGASTPYAAPLYDDALAARLLISVLDVPGPRLVFSKCAIWQERTDRDPGSRYFREPLVEVARLRR